MESEMHKHNATQIKTGFFVIFFFKKKAFLSLCQLFLVGGDGSHLTSVCLLSNGSRGSSNVMLLHRPTRCYMEIETWHMYKW